MELSDIDPPILFETNQVALAVVESEKRLRLLVQRGVLMPPAFTRRGTMLFDDQAIECARGALAEERKA